MLDRLAARAAFRGALILLSFSCGAAAAGGAAATVSEPLVSAMDAAGLLPSFEVLTRLGIAAPFLSAVLLLVAAAGWRLLDRDIESRVRRGRALAERTLADRDNRLHQAMHASADGVFVLRTIRGAPGAVIDFEVVDVNPAGARLVRAAEHAIVGTRLRHDARGWLDAAHFGKYASVVPLREPLLGENRVNRRHFDASWLLEQAVPIADGLAVTIRDISARRREERTLCRASITDHLTALLNRRGFLTLAEQRVPVARRSGKDCVLLYADMDGFKGLDDRFGHAEGDRALRAVARLLRRAVRDCDPVARLGGDEFTIMAVDSDGAGVRSIQQRIEQRLAALNGLGELAATVGLTVGHARVRPSDDATLAELLGRADALLYSRKAQRKSAVGPAAHAARPGDVPGCTPEPTRGAADEPVAAALRQPATSRRAPPMVADLADGVPSGAH